jgi:hypothetical protein
MNINAIYDSFTHTNIILNISKQTNHNITHNIKKKYLLISNNSCNKYNPAIVFTHHTIITINQFETISINQYNPAICFTHTHNFYPNQFKTNQITILNKIFTFYTIFTINITPQYVSLIHNITTITYFKPTTSHKYTKHQLISNNSLKLRLSECKVITTANRPTEVRSSPLMTTA